MTSDWLRWFGPAWFLFVMIMGSALGVLLGMPPARAWAVATLGSGVGTLLGLLWAISKEPPGP